MDATELLAQFRALGGIADNVCIRRGPHGHGVFAVNPAQKARVLAPAHLLVSPQMLELAPDGQVKVRPASALRADIAAFHENYQRSVGWGAGGFLQISQHRQRLRALPDTLKSFLHILGCTDDLQQLPSPQDAFKAHCISRQIGVNGASMLMPVLELINHASNGTPYVVAPDSVSLSGIFQDEVLACYRQHLDAFHFFFNYHFAAPARSVLSCEVRIDIPGFKALRISRLDGLSDLRSGVRVPHADIHRDEIHLSFVELANLDQPALPRQVFVELLAVQGLPGSSAHELFDGLLAHNRQVLQDFLKACESAHGPVIPDLQAIATCQLTNLG